MATILIVDDYDTNREFLVTLLGYRGHRLLEAADGLEALTLARRERPDLVIADILMPTMDGYEFVRQLRADPAIAQIPVIFYTAYYHEQEAQALAQACGVAHILTKPSEPELVLHTVDAALGLTAAPLAAVQDEFDREHLRLLTDKLSQNAAELRKANLQLTALIEISLQLASERDPQRLLEQFCHTARDLIGAKHAAVGILGEDGQSLRLFFISGMDAERAVGIGAPTPQTGVLGNLLVERRAIRLQNPGGDPGAVGFSPTYPPIYSFLAAPIVSPTQAYGWICLTDKIGAAEFSDAQERLVAILAAQVGRIYENGTLYHGAQRYATQLEQEVAERQLAQAALSASETKYRTLIEHIPAITYVAALDEASSTLYVSPQVEAILGFSQAEWMADPRRWLKQLHPLDLDQVLADVMRSQAGDTPIRSEFRMLTGDGRVVWFHDEAVVMRNDAGQALSLQGVMIDITERKQAEQELAERVRLAALGADVGVALTNGDSLRQILQPCAEAMVRHLDAAFARIWTLNEADQVLELQASAGMYTHRDGAHSRIPVGMFKIGLIAQERQPHLSNAVLEDPRVSDPEWAKHEGMVAFAGYPLIVAEQLVGVMALFARKRLTQATLDMLASVADEIALGVERKQTEETLRHSEELYRLITENAGDLISLLDREGRTVYASPSFRQVLGYDPAALIGTFEFDLIHPNDLPAILDIWAQLPIQGAVEATLRCRHADGSWRWIEARGTAVIGHPSFSIVSVARDVTERKQMEATLEQQYSLLHAVIEGTPDAVYVKDLQGCHLMINAAGARMLDRSVEEVIGKDDAALFEADTARQLSEADRRIMEIGEIETYEHSVTVASGMRTYLSTKAPYRDQHGNVIGVIGISRDITERKRLEAQLLQSQKMESIGRLAGGIAHDFNNMLSAVIGFIGSAQEQLPKDNPAQRDLEVAESAAWRAAGLTRQLLAFARKQVVEPQVLNLNTAILDLDKMLRRLIGEDIELVTLSAPDLGHVKVDPGQIEQVIVNLAVNARDAMSHGGKLTIETANTVLDADYAQQHAGVIPDAYIMLAISDTGSGMDAEVQQHLFEPFFTTKEPGKGTGLGLATCYGIVKQHSGHIWVYSEVGHGTTFKIYLPRVEAAPDEQQQRDETTALLQGSETVLLVEDEPLVRELASTILRQQGYTLLVASNGEEALRMIQAEAAANIDLLVTDIVMPRMGGKALAEQVASVYPNIKVLFISGYAADAITHHGRLEPGTNFLAKPFSRAAFARKVREVLDS